MIWRKAHLRARRPLVVRPPQPGWVAQSVEPTGGAPASRSDVACGGTCNGRRAVMVDRHLKHGNLSAAHEILKPELIFARNRWRRHRAIYDVCRSYDIILRWTTRTLTNAEDSIDPIAR